MKSCGDWWRVTFTRFRLVMAGELVRAGRNSIAFSSQFQMFQRTRNLAQLSLERSSKTPLL